MAATFGRRPLETLLPANSTLLPARESFTCRQQEAAAAAAKEQEEEEAKE